MFMINALMTFWLFLPSPVSAHPLGNFTINRYSRLELTDGQIRLVYIVDMAEIPTHQERVQLDGNGDGLIAIEEETRYLHTQLAQLQANLSLRVNGVEIVWRQLNSHLEFPEGQAGLPTQRLTARFEAGLLGQNAIWQVEYNDENYRGRLGWQEVVVKPGKDVTLLTSSAPSIDVSQELRQYPGDLLQRPLAVNQATFQFRPVVRGNTSASDSAQLVSSFGPKIVNAGAAEEAVGKPDDPFAELIKIPLSGPNAILLALLAAFGWGAAHAFSPGHGKTIVGAYLVGARGTMRHALFLGLTTTITHTAGVFVLGLITLFASRFILPETLFPWLTLVSGLLVVGIGLAMAWRWLRNLLGYGQHGQMHHHHGDHHHDDHHHGDHYHDDGQHHHHLLLHTGDEEVTWRDLLALGVSGGLVPCPSALVVMLGAIALNRIGFGLLLIIVFSLGLASVLTAFGVVLIHAGKLFTRLPENNGRWGGRLVHALPVASALFITALGVGLTIQAVLGIL